LPYKKQHEALSGFNFTVTEENRNLIRKFYEGGAMSEFATSMALPTENVQKVMEASLNSQNLTNHINNFLQLFTDIDMENLAEQLAQDRFSLDNMLGLESDKEKSKMLEMLEECAEMLEDRYFDILDWRVEDGYGVDDEVCFEVRYYLEKEWCMEAWRPKKQERGL
jgi:hypothetical protein